MFDKDRNLEATTRMIRELTNGFMFATGILVALAAFKHFGVI
ncbi:hypothetical protein [Aeromonas enteropelogenes]|nr:hypothetical protein [Aeromonas enteropelogenes]